MNKRETMGAKTGETDRVGFYGKVPSHGDFVSGTLGQTTLKSLDAWLQRGLAALELRLGPDWKDQYLAAPPWRFAIGAGICGPAALAGVLLPSSDRVGRPFPLTLVAQLQSFSGNPRQLCFDTTWFTAAEAIAETSRMRDFELGQFASTVKSLRVPHAREDADLKIERDRSIWWTIDPHSGDPRGFMATGLPAPETFARFVLQPDATPTPETPPRPELGSTTVPEAKNQDRAAARPLRLSHGSATHPGTRMTLNADAILAADGPGLFVVADGIGDTTAAAEAARLTTQMLAGIRRQASLIETLQEVKGKLGRAHGLLQSGGAVARDSVAASVAVLAVDDSEFAIVWAGDTRCYHLRAGMMRCLTKDHVEIGLRRSIARSIGGRRQLIPEVLVAPVEAGDRFLLCSNPVVRVLSERQIAETLLSELAEKDPAKTAEALVQNALIATARDNVSAIIIDVKS